MCRHVHFPQGFGSWTSPTLSTDLHASISGRVWAGPGPAGPCGVMDMILVV
jgi:hypothetical protein